MSAYSVGPWLTVSAASWTYRLRSDLLSSYCHHYPCGQVVTDSNHWRKYACKWVDIQIACGICIYSSVMTVTHLQEAPLTVGSLIQDTENWQAALLTDWLDLFAKNLVTGNLQLLHICFFMSFCSGLDASQRGYVTTLTAVFKQTAAAKLLEVWRLPVRNTLNAPRTAIMKRLGVTFDTF